MSTVAVVGFDPLRDKSYQQTRLGRDVVDFLAWLELGGAASRTLDQYERDLSRAALMFPQKGMEDIDDGDALHIAKQFKPAERKARIAPYRTMWKWGRGARRVTVNPFDALPRMKAQPRRVFDIFTDDEIAALTNLPVRDGALMQILIDCGPRKGDARKLQLKHYRPEPTLDEPYGVFVFREGKGGNDRTAPLTEAVAQKLADLVLLEGLNSNDHLWYATPANGVSRRIRRTTPCGEGTFARWWRRCLDDAGVRYRNPHMTRHTMATRWLRRRGRLETLSLVLGHASIKTTMDLYGHLDRRDVGRDLLLIEGKV